MARLSNLLKGKGDFKSSESLGTNVNNTKTNTTASIARQSIDNAIKYPRLSDVLKQDAIQEPVITELPTASTLPTVRGRRSTVVNTTTKAGQAQAKAEERKRQRAIELPQVKADAIMRKELEEQRKVNIKGAEQRLETLLAESKAIENSPEPDFQAQSRLTDEILQVRNTITANQPGFKSGFRESFGFQPTAKFGAQLSTPEREIAQQSALEQAQTQKGFTAGRVGGEVVKQAALYATIGAALKGTQLGANLAARFGGGASGQFLSGQAVDLLVDTVIQTPQEVLRGESLGQIGKNRLFDVFLNLAIGGSAEGIKALKSLKNADTEAFEQAIKQLPPEQANTVRRSIQEELGIPKDTTAQDFLAQQTKEFEAGQVEDIFKQFDRTPQQIMDDFQAWRSKNFGGATGRVSDEDFNTLKQLYKEDTGIDLDVAIKEVEGSIPKDTFVKPQSELTFEATRNRFEPLPTDPINRAPFETTLSTRPVDTVGNSNTPLTNVLKSDTVQPGATKNIASNIEQSNFDENMLISDLPTVAKGEPIDTKSLITLELPKTPAQTFTEKYDRAVQELVGKYDFLGKVSEKARVQSSNLNRTLGSIEHNVIGNQTDMLGNNIGKSVTDIFGNVKNKDKAELFEYIFHKHNIDRAMEGKPVFGNTVDSNMSKEFVRNYELANPTAVQTQQEIVKYFNNLLNEWAVPSGLTSQETADFLGDLYKNYVPTVRVKNLPKTIGQGNQAVAQILKKAKGSEDKILPLDQMMIMQTDRVIKNARKNEMLNTLADAFERGEGNVSKRVFDIKGGEKELIDDAFEIGTHLDAEPLAKGNEYLINFYRNGEPMQMVVDKVTYEAFKPQNFDNMVNKVAQTFKKYAANPFKSLITEYNPAFSVANVMRDIPTAIAFSDNAFKMTLKVPEAVKEILTNGPKFRQFKALGGTREGLIGAGKEFKVPTLGDKTMLQQVSKQVNKANPFKYISDVNNFTETIPRFSEYLAVLEKTGDPALAIYKSADLTTDFAKHGNSTKLLDSFVPYLNPQVQGMDKFARTIIKKPVKTAMGAGAAITVPTIILDQINKYDEAYNNLSSRERNLYFQIPYEDKNGDRQFIRIPKSRELGVAFSSIYDWAARKSRGEDVTGEEIKQAIEENFGVGITPLWEPAAKAWSQIKDPDAYETNYWGGLIVPQSQRKYSPGEQYDMNSSGISKAIGQQFNISPYVVDYLIDSYGGVAGDFILPIGADRKKDLLLPLTGRFKSDPVFKSDSTNKFYTLLNEATEEANDFNRINDLPTSGPDNIVTPLEEKASLLRKVASEMTKLRKEQKELQTERGNEDKIRELQKAINALADEAVRGNE